MPRKTPETTAKVTKMVCLHEEMFLGEGFLYMEIKYNFIKKQKKIEYRDQ